jgi:hypothetical protein
MHALFLRIAVLGPVWLYHPLGNCTGTHAERTRCLSYNFWSGIGSDLAYIATIGGLRRLALVQTLAQVA